MITKIPIITNRFEFQSKSNKKNSSDKNTLQINKIISGSIFIEQRASLNKQLITFTGKDSALVKEMESKKLNPLQLGKIYIAASRFNDEDSDAVKKHCLDKLKENFSNKTDKGLLNNTISALGEIAANSKDEKKQRELYDLIIDKGFNPENATVQFAVMAIGKIGSKTKNPTLKKDAVDYLIKNNINSGFWLEKENAYEALYQIASSTKNDELLAQAVKIAKEKGISNEDHNIKRFSIEFSGVTVANTQNDNMVNELFPILVDGLNDDNELTKRCTILTLKDIALKKGDFATTENIVADAEGNPIAKTIFSKVLEEIKSTRKSTKDADTYTEAFLAEKELEKAKFIKFTNLAVKKSDNGELPSNVQPQILKLCEE